MGTSLIPANLEVGTIAPDYAGPLPLLVPLDQPDSLRQFITSLPLVSREDKELLLGLMQSKHDKLGDLIGEEILVEHFVMQTVQFTDQDSGKPKMGVRTVLLSPDGETYACCSDGVASSLRLYAQVMGKPPWPGGVRFKVVQQETNEGRRFFQLIPPSSATQRTKKKK